MSNGGPHDHPGSYRVIKIGNDSVAFQQALDQAEADGYNFTGMNDTFIVLYKEDKH